MDGGRVIALSGLLVSANIFSMSYEGPHFYTNYRTGAFTRVLNDFSKKKHAGFLSVNPKIIVLLAGTNNLRKVPTDTADTTVASVTAGIEAILKICRSKAPKATIILMGIFPRNDNMAVMPIINQINNSISKFADGKKIRYLNINDKMADKDGKLFEGITVKDGLHLDVKGYQVWADALKPIFKKLLGPPAKEDLAPPPTGDPSAKKP